MPCNYVPRYCDVISEDLILTSRHHSEHFYPSHFSTQNQAFTRKTVRYTFLNWRPYKSSNRFQKRLHLKNLESKSHYKIDSFSKIMTPTYTQDLRGNHSSSQCLERAAVRSISSESMRRECSVCCFQKPFQFGIRVFMQIIMPAAQ